MKEYSLTVTNKCNWNCSYCVADTHGTPSILVNNMQDIIDTINKMENNSKVSLTGGEPGVLNNSDMEQIINLLNKKNCKIVVQTNGEFFNKFEYLDKYIYQYNYHMSENLDENYTILAPDYIIKDKMEYNIVLTNENFMKLPKFLKLNPHTNTIKSAIGYLNPMSKKNILYTISKFNNILTENQKKDLFSCGCDPQVSKM